MPWIGSALNGILFMNRFYYWHLWWVKENIWLAFHSYIITIIMELTVLILLLYKILFKNKFQFCWMHKNYISSKVTLLYFALQNFIIFFISMNEFKSNMKPDHTNKNNLFSFLSFFFGKKVSYFYFFAQFYFVSIIWTELQCSFQIQ